jgi:type IX secretion system PorP/SprF family membrane protein
MKKLFAKVALMVAGFTGVAVAQQDPQFTQFMFNKLIYNPGYAGTTGAICAVGQYRQQWMSFSGGASTRAIAADMRLSKLPIGVGLTFIGDQIGPLSTTYVRLAGSFNVTKIAGGTLGIGLDVGMVSRHLTNDWVVPEPLKDDPRIPGNGGYNPNTGTFSFQNPDLNKTSLDLGFGVFYQIPGKFYAGLSTTHLPSSTLKGASELRSTVSRHYYFMAGYTFQINKWSKVTPNVLWKAGDSKSYNNSIDAGTPNMFVASTADLNLTFLWSDMIWIGGTYRLNDAPAILAGIQGNFGVGNAYSWKLGYSYDMTTKKLQGYAKGSHEIVLGICYAPKVKKPTVYSNDRYLD